MRRKIVVTETEVRGKNIRITAGYEEDELCDMYFSTGCEDSRIGAIYVAKIRDMVPQIGGMFVEYEKGRSAFLRFEDAKHIIYTQKFSKGDKPHAGDELLIEITGDALKTKDDTASAGLTFQERGFLLLTDSRSVGVSKKISGNRRKKYRTMLEDIRDEQFGILLRTAGADLPEEELREEVTAAQVRLNDWLAAAKNTSLYSELRSPQPDYLQYLERASEQDEIEVISDNPDVISDLRDRGLEREGLSLRLYEDEKLPLSALYSLKTEAERLLDRRVYLSSGAYLVVDACEAMTVVDVNSGKKQGKSRENYITDINLEAAEELFRQLRLRNISGMILVDLINMQDSADTDYLLAAMRHMASMDPVSCQVIDITALGLVEITRKKLRRSLAEQFRSDEKSKNFAGEKSN